MRPDPSSPEPAAGGAQSSWKTCSPGRTYLVRFRFTAGWHDTPSHRVLPTGSEVAMLGCSGNSSTGSFRRGLREASTRATSQSRYVCFHSVFSVRQHTPRSSRSGRPPVMSGAARRLNPPTVRTSLAARRSCHAPLRRSCPDSRLARKWCNKSSVRLASFSVTRHNSDLPLHRFILHPLAFLGQGFCLGLPPPRISALLPALFPRGGSWSRTYTPTP